METIGINRILLEILYALRNLNDAITKSLGAGYTSDDEWIFEHEAMSILNTTSRKSLYNWRKIKLLKYKNLGRTPVYLKSSVDKLADKMKLSER